MTAGRLRYLAEAVPSAVKPPGWLQLSLEQVPMRDSGNGNRRKITGNGGFVNRRGAGTTGGPRQRSVTSWASIRVSSAENRARSSDGWASLGGQAAAGALPWWAGQAASDGAGGLNMAVLLRWWWADKSGFLAHQAFYQRMRYIFPLIHRPIKRDIFALCVRKT
jgi:hypothetical protein